MTGFALALMLAAAPVRWADPRTWPWFVWWCIAVLLLGWAKPAWQWFKRQRAQGWPTVTGRIESVEVKQIGPFQLSSARRGRGPAYAAQLAYSYTVEGHYYSGYYQREFASEEEGWEFVRDLRGRSAIVSYIPRNPAKSMLSEDAVTALLSASPPPPEGKFQVCVSELPGWAKPLLWPFILLSAVGLGLSFLIYFGAVAWGNAGANRFAGRPHFILQNPVLP